MSIATSNTSNSTRSRATRLFDLHGFDLAYVSRIFPGYVFERRDTRSYPEPRFQVIGELLGELFFVVYTPRGRICRLITAWIAEPISGTVV